jgi:hypothetical protein
LSKHTERTIALLHGAGLHCDVVERWIPGAGVRRDFIGCIDIIAFSHATTLGVQSCGEDFAGHARKMLAEPRLLRWLEAPERHAVLVGWRKIAAYRQDGTRAARDRWAPRVQYFASSGGKVILDGEELDHLRRYSWPNVDPIDLTDPNLEGRN